MTEVPSAILWIASISLILMTVLLCALLIALLMLTRSVRQLVEKIQEIAEPLKGAAEQAGNTVQAYSSSLLKPLATIAGVVAGFRKGATTVGDNVGGRRKRKK
ncbi:hypothetical protein EXS54_00870 [Patescibacteria group bacterium]|nr:hypothetical protein [Patescibacteria group bacterium]